MAILSLMSKGEAQSSSSLFFNDFVGTKIILFSKNEDSTYMSHAIGELYFQKYNFFVKYIVWGFHKDGEKLFPMNICFVKITAWTGWTDGPNPENDSALWLMMPKSCWICDKFGRISLAELDVGKMIQMRSKWGLGLEE